MTYPKAAIQRGITTADLADAIGTKPGSIRVRLCTHGSYFGLRPFKLPNGRLLWPEDSVQRLVEQGGRG